MKRLLLLGFLLALIAPTAFSQCSNTSYGNGATCVHSDYVVSGSTNITSSTITLTQAPIAGHAGILTAYSCRAADCFGPVGTTLAVSDNLHTPETCFLASPHSPFALHETSVGNNYVQQYMWMCPNLPSGLSKITVSCSVANGCSFINLAFSEWIGLATVNPWDADGSCVSAFQQTSLTCSTSSSSNFTNELIYGALDTNADHVLTMGSPALMISQNFWNSNKDSSLSVGGMTVAATGTQTLTATWTGSDDWYGTIAAIKTAESQLNAAPEPSTGLKATVH